MHTTSDLREKLRVVEVSPSIQAIRTFSSYLSFQRFPATALRQFNGTVAVVAHPCTCFRPGLTFRRMAIQMSLCLWHSGQDMDDDEG